MLKPIIKQRKINGTATSDAAASRCNHVQVIYNKACSPSRIQREQQSRNKQHVILLGIQVQKGANIAQ